MTFKGLLAGAAAVLFAAGVATASNLSLLSGPQDPSQLLATVNTLIQNINFGVSGRLNASLTATGTTTTIENTMATYSLPASRLAADGDSVRVVCWGTTASNANAKTIKLYFGASSISSASGTSTTVNTFGNKWKLTLTVMRSGAALQTVMGDGMVGTAPVSVYTNAGTDTLTAAVVIKCTGTTPTAAQDVTMQGMLVEQIK